MTTESLNHYPLKAAIEAYCDCFPDAGEISYEGLKAGIRAYLNTLGTTSAQPESTGEAHGRMGVESSHTLNQERDRLISFARENHNWSQDWQKGVEDAFVIVGNFLKRSEMPVIGKEDINQLRDALCEMAGDINLLQQQLKAGFPERESVNHDIEALTEKVLSNWRLYNCATPYLKAKAAVKATINSIEVQ